MATAQDNTYVVAGSRFWFKRDSEGSTHYPLIDMGTVSEMTPGVEPTMAELRDPYADNGIVDQQITQVDRSFEFTLRDFAPLKLAIALYGLSAALAQTGAQSTNVSQPAADIHAGELHRIKDASGVLVTRLASVDSVRLADDTACVLGTDYEVVDLDLGLIRALPGGNIVTGNAIEITYTTATFAGFRIAPDTKPLVQGLCMISTRGRSNAWRADYKQFRANLVPTSLAFPATEHGSYGIRATVLSTPTQVGYEQGRFDIIRE